MPGQKVLSGASASHSLVLEGRVWRQALRRVSGPSVGPKATFGSEWPKPKRPNQELEETRTNPAPIAYKTKPTWHPAKSMRRMLNVFPAGEVIARIQDHARLQKAAHAFLIVDDRYSEIAPFSSQGSFLVEGFASRRSRYGP